MDNSDQELDQQGAPTHKAMPQFDISRAVLRNKELFEPFYVKVTIPMRRAVDEGEVREDTPILLMKNDGDPLALLTHQMTYHHVAQGEMSGQPWMVSF